MRKFTIGYVAGYDNHGYAYTCIRSAETPEAAKAALIKEKREEFEWVEIEAIEEVMVIEGRTEFVPVQ